jgi:hypothetical protein
MVMLVYIREKRMRLFEQFLFILVITFKTPFVIELCFSWLQVYSGNTNTIDGCATFFRRDRFSHVKKYEVWICLASC